MHFPVTVFGLVQGNHQLEFFGCVGGEVVMWCENQDSKKDTFSLFQYFHPLNADDAGDAGSASLASSALRGTSSGTHGFW